MNATDTTDTTGTSAGTTRRSRTMSTRTKLAAYGGLLVVSFAAAAGIAAAVGPIDTSGRDRPHAGPHEQPTPGHADGAGRPHLPGLSVDADGFRIVPDTTSLATGTATDYVFRIVDAQGRTVTAFDVTHERELHLIVVARDSAQFHHVHPAQDAAGSWSVELPGLPAGSYRVFADMRPSGSEAITLGTDLLVDGDSAHTAPTDQPTTGATTSVDGYDVTISGDPRVGETTLSFSVERDGAAVVPDPYLGASGHLVALRSGDLAFLHVHPLGDATAADPAVRFAAELPTPGTYRLFLDLSLDGEVRTAAFTIDVPEPGDADQHDTSNPDTDSDTDQHEGDH